MTIENNDAIVTDAPENDSTTIGRAYDETSAAEAFRKVFSKTDADTKKPSGETTREEKRTSDESDHNSSDDSSDGDIETTTDDESIPDDNEGESEADVEEGDDDIIPVKVNGETKEFKLKDLKRLAGQEAALNSKNEAVAKARKEYESERERFAIASSKLLERARERYKPYENIDWLVASREWDAPTLQAVRTEATAAYQELQLHENELKTLSTQIQNERRNAMVEKAKEAVPILEKEIPNFKAVYKEMGEYAVKNGLPLEMFNSVVEPAALKILYKAMQFDRGRAVQTKPVNKAPTKVVKSTRNISSTRQASRPNEVKDSMARLKQTGSTDDAANAFLALMHAKH